MDEHGEIIGYFESSTQAAKCHGVFLSNLHRALRKGSLYRGRKWMYEEEYRDYWMQRRTKELSYTEHEIRSRRAAKSWSKLTPEQRKERGRLISKGLRASAKVQQFDAKAAWTATSRPVMCVNTGERYPSIAKCARSIGASPAGVAQALKVGRKIKGFIITYIK